MLTKINSQFQSLTRQINAANTLEALHPLGLEVARFDKDYAEIEAPQYSGKELANNLWDKLDIRKQFLLREARRIEKNQQKSN